MHRRYAVSSGNYATVSRYLPSNYEAFVHNGQTYIVGIDYAGWTLDAYVIPRLASGCIGAREIPEGEAPVREYAVCEFSSRTSPASETFWSGVAHDQLDALSRFAEAEGHARYDESGLENVDEVDGLLVAVFSNIAVVALRTSQTYDRADVADIL